MLRLCFVTAEYETLAKTGGLADASDASQIHELVTLGSLVKRAKAAGVQVMVEGPGHMPLDQIAANVRLILDRLKAHRADMPIVICNVFPVLVHAESFTPEFLGILLASNQLQSELLEDWGVVGELALDGNTRPTKGALSIAMAAASSGCIDQEEEYATLPSSDAWVVVAVRLEDSST